MYVLYISLRESRCHKLRPWEVRRLCYVVSLCHYFSQHGLASKITFESLVKIRPATFRNGELKVFHSEMHIVYAGYAPRVSISRSTTSRRAIVRLPRVRILTSSYSSRYVLEQLSRSALGLTSEPFYSCTDSLLAGPIAPSTRYVCVSEDERQLISPS